MGLLFSFCSTMLTSTRCVSGFSRLEKFCLYKPLVHTNIRTDKSKFSGLSTIRKPSVFHKFISNSWGYEQCNCALSAISTAVGCTLIHNNQRPRHTFFENRALCGFSRLFRAEQDSCEEHNKGKLEIKNTKKLI